MRKFLLSLVMLASLGVFAGTVSAQNKVDVYAGVQVVRVNPDFQQANSFRFNGDSDSIGANGSVTVFVSDSVGITGELAGTTSGTSAGDTSVITGMGGLILQANRGGRLQPFFRGLVGGVRERVNSQQFTNILDRSDVGFAFAVGGGLDVQLSKRVALRLVQADYLQTRVFGQAQNNVRVGAGIRF